MHYAGFFDPGCVWPEAAGSGIRAVPEVRRLDVRFLLGRGHTVGHLVYGRLIIVPNQLYGPGIGSNYRKQTPT